MFGTILENVGMDIEGRQIDLNDATLRRIRALLTRSPPSPGSTPRRRRPPEAHRDADGGRLRGASADLFHDDRPGDVPLPLRLHGQGGGDRAGVVEPQATFSTCFGGPFMALAPSVYAKLLGEKVAAHRVKVWLVNTGWTGGPYGTGRRMNINHTKAMLRAALSGKLDGVESREDPVFGLRVPRGCPDVPPEVLDPRSTWKDPAAYDRTARKLAGMFHENFAKYSDQVTPEVRAGGVRIPT